MLNQPILFEYFRNHSVYHSRYGMPRDHNSYSYRTHFLEKVRTLFDLELFMGDLAKQPRVVYAFGLH